MAFRSSAIANSTGGEITATPAGVAVDDYLGAFYVADSNTPTLTPATNFVERAQVTLTLDNQRLFFADKIATGSDTFNFSDSVGNANALIVSALSGRDTTSPRSTSPVTTGDSNSNTTPISASLTGITASLDDDILICLATDQNAASGRWTYSTITDYTERHDGIAADWTSGTALQTRDAVAAGATGNFSVTITRNSGTGNAGYGGIVVALKAAAAAWPPGGSDDAPEKLRVITNGLRW